MRCGRPLKEALRLRGIERKNPCTLVERKTPKIRPLFSELPQKGRKFLPRDVTAVGIDDIPTGGIEVSDRHDVVDAMQMAHERNHLNVVCAQAYQPRRIVEIGAARGQTLGR